MKKIFGLILFLFAFIFAFSSVCLAQVQEPEPIVVSENTATETVVTYTEYTFKRLTIEVGDNGFMDSRIIVVAGLGKRLTTTDPVTTFKLFESAKNSVGQPIEVEVFNGKLSVYLALLNEAQTATVITEQQKNAIIAGQLGIYSQSFDGFKTTVNILLALGKLELKAKKVVK